MKKYGGLALAALILAATLALASCGSSAGSGDSNDMKDMDHKEMKSGGKSGGMKGMEHGNGDYSDRAFIDDMVVHHQGAVEMARVALKNAKHEEIVTLSRNIISTQQAEIQKLKSIKKREFGTSDIPMDMGSRQMGGMGMVKPGLLASKRPFDRAFIDAMIPHHESAIEMSRAASEKSGNPEIQSLADDIISAQAREIEQMKSWRDEWYP